MTPISFAILAACTATFTAAGIAWFLVRQVKIAFDEFQARTNKRQQAFTSELGRLRGELETLRNRTEEAERHAASAAVPRHPMTGLNLSHRTQALRLIRRGEAPDKIAAILGVPQTEIELLQKVQRLLTLDT